jgi:hypothetical protein
MISAVQSVFPAAQEQRYSGKVHTGVHSDRGLNQALTIHTVPRWDRSGFATLSHTCHRVTARRD